MDYLVIGGIITLACVLAYRESAKMERFRNTAVTAGLASAVCLIIGITRPEEFHHIWYGFGIASILTAVGFAIAGRVQERSAHRRPRPVRARRHAA